MEEIRKILKELGIPERMSGYVYLVKALILCVYDMENAGSITKLVYPDVAKAYQTTGKKVERAIRNLIDVSWRSGNQEGYEKVFGYSDMEGAVRPTNSEFIAILADYLRLHTSVVMAASLEGDTDFMDKPAICGGTPVRDTKIFYGHQYIDEDDIQAVVEVLRSDYLTCGPKIEELEKALCRVTRAKYAVVCSNGTAALHIACLAAGVKEGDEVITTPITFAASANCALFCGAKPVFADINEETYNIDPACVKKLTTEKTKAVVAVDYTGQSVELDRLLEHCHEHNITLIEDGAHVIGTKYKGKCNGSIADMTTLSFHPVKTVTCGEGGAVLTNSKELYQRLLLFRSHGITRDPALMQHKPDGPWYYEQLELSTNYRMTDIQAALLISQLKKLPAFSARRKEIVKAYDEAFRELPQITVQKEIPESDTTRHLYILRIRPDKLTINRKQFFEALGAENICCNVHYIPTYYFPYYEKLGYQKGLCPKAEKLYEEIISLPLYYAMTDQDVSDVIAAVRKIATYYSK